MSPSLWTPPGNAASRAPSSLWTPSGTAAASCGCDNKTDSQPLSPTRIRNPGRRFAQIVRLKPEYVDEYKKVHAAVWPQVLTQIKDCKIEDYSIYHEPETGILFARFKYVGYDYAGDMERMRENPKVREWWKLTDAMQESLVAGAKDSESGEPAWWKPIEEVFYQA